MAQIHSMFRPVLITCTIKPAWTASDRIGMRYNGAYLRMRNALSGVEPPIVPRNATGLAGGAA